VCCASGQTCSNGTCVATCVALEQPCGSNSQCCSGTCAISNCTLSAVCCSPAGGSCSSDCDCCGGAGLCIFGTCNP
jgi:hypothetical protein